MSAEQAQYSAKPVHSTQYRQSRFLLRDYIVNGDRGRRVKIGIDHETSLCSGSPMNRSCLERSQSPTGVFGVLIAVAATAVLVNFATCTAALAQQLVSIAQQRDEAPIWHVQPRIQDLPPDVAQEEE